MKLDRREFLKLFGLLGGIISIPDRPFIGEERVDTNKYHPNIILIVLDSLTARNMSLFGYKRNTTPHLERIADQSTIYHHHYSAGSFTNPSTASLITGTYPWTNRTFHLFDYPIEKYREINLFSSIPSDHCQKIAYTHNPHVYYSLDFGKNHLDLLEPINTLTEKNNLHFLFNEDFNVGYQATRNWIARPEQYLSSSIFFQSIYKIINFIQNINKQSKTESFSPEASTVTYENYHYLLEDSIDWIYDQITTRKKPFCGYFHLYPPHSPYKPRSDFFDIYAEDNLEIFEKPTKYFPGSISPKELFHLRQRYDEFVAYTDSEIGRLFSLLEDNGLLEDTCLMITSDHGEMFERGIHGHLNPTLYEPLVHIPLVIHFPGQISRINITEPTSTIDIAPTILNLCGIKIPNYMEGVPVPRVAKKANMDRPIFVMDGKENHKLQPLRKATLAIIKWPYKYINYRGYPKYQDADEMYNLDDDPEELSDLAEIEVGVLRLLKEELLDHLLSAESQSLSPD